MKKKFLLLACSIGITFSAFYSTKAEASAPEPNKIIGNVTLKTNVNIRSNDSFTSKIVKVLPKGNRKNVYLKKNGMYYLGSKQWVTANSKYVTYHSNGANNIPKTVSKHAPKVINAAKKNLGKKYTFGGITPKGFDCSGFIYYVYKNSGYKINRMSAASYHTKSKSVKSPKAGDLVFFKNTYKSGISHVGIYIGEKKFIHVSDDGVMIDSLSNSYYKKHFYDYRRF